MYGLNPSITGKDNPNSPYYENPCELCKHNQCCGCIHNDEYENETKDREQDNAERMAEMYSEIY